MTDVYKVSIRCDHTTPAGAQRSPRIAWAKYIEQDNEWFVTSTIPARVTDEPRDVRAAARKADRNGTQSSLLHKYGSAGPVEDRVELTCNACKQRLVAVKTKLDKVLELARHADVHTLTFSNIRANL